jgi:hypothetical protein
MREHALAWLAYLDNAAMLDLSLVNSVVQYMHPAEFAGWLVRWRKLLAAGGNRCFPT